MLSFLRAPHPSFTRNAHVNPITYETTTSTTSSKSPSSQPSQIQFHPPSTRKSHFTMTNIVPPSSEPGNLSIASILTPPPHFHLYQSEQFRVISGTASIFMGLSPGPIATVSSSSSSSSSSAAAATATATSKERKHTHITARRLHRFINASTTHPLTIEIQLTPEDYAASQKFFRNFFGYLDDCKKAHVEPSIFQLMVFLHAYDTPLAVVPVALLSTLQNVFVSLGVGPVIRAPVERGLEMVLFYVSWLVMLVVAGVGRFLLGYRDTYEEYYIPGQSLNLDVDTDLVLEPSGPSQGGEEEEEEEESKKVK